MKRKIGVNEPCPCGSGKKYKKCCIDKGFDWVENEEGEIAKSIPMTPEFREIIDLQRVRFRGKYGRDMGPGDPIFFDAPPPEHAEFFMAREMKKAGMPPELVYAFEKTGLLVTETNQHLIPEKDLQEWDDAVQEYFDRLDAGELDENDAEEAGETSPPK